MLLLVLATVLGCSRQSSSTVPVVPPVSAVEPSAIAILRGWDARRASAYAGGDLVRLRRLYVDGSSAAAADVRLLRTYLARGYVVRGMTRQLFDVRVLIRRPRLLRLRVTDRLAMAVAVGTGGRTTLPRGSAVTRTLTLRKVAGTWRVSSVRRVPR